MRSRKQNNNDVSSSSSIRLIPVTYESRMFLDSNYMTLGIYLIVVSLLHVVGYVAITRYYFVIFPYKIAFVYVTAVLATILYATLVFKDAGTIQAFKNHAISTFADNNDRFCSTCNIVKAPRVKHCREIDRCVKVFDHYCCWINNAVGSGNHRIFLLFLLVQITSLVASFAFIIYNIRHAPTPSVESFFHQDTDVVHPDLLRIVFNGLSPNTFMTFILKRVLAAPLTTVVLLPVVFIALVSLSYIIYHTLTGISSNLTWNESINGYRYEYLSYGKIVNNQSHVLDVGFYQNWKQFIYNKR